MKMMFLLKYIFFLSFVICPSIWAYSNKSKTNDDNFMRYLNETYTELCPHLEFCSKADYINKTDELPCSCRSNCYLYDSCCQGFARQNQQTLNCSAFVYHMTGSAVSYINGNNFGINMYRQVTTCAHDFPQNTETFDMCVNDKNTIEFEDVVAVSDVDGNVYKNHHCAKCNNVTSYIWFDLHILCKEQFSNAVFEVMNMTSLFESSCEIWSNPPKPEIGLQSRCFEADVTSCNETGNWEKYDPNIEKACNSFTFLYIHKVTRVVIYKNIYCFLCNHKQFYLIESMNERQCLYDEIENLKFGYQALTATLNFKLFSPAEPKRQIKGRRCSKGFYDFYYDICRDVICPIGTIVAAEKCIDLYKRMAGWTFILFFHIQASEDIDVSKDMNDVVSAAINAAEIFDIGSRLCRYLLLKNVSASNSSAFTLMLVLESNEEFTFESSSKRMQELRQRSPTFSLVLHNRKLTYFSIHLATEIKSLDVVQKMNVEGLKQKRRCLGSSNILSSTTNCPRIEVQFDDFESVKKRSGLSFTDIRMLSVVENPQNSFHVNGTTNITARIEICVDDYKRIINNISIATSNVYQIYWTSIMMSIYLFQYQYMFDQART